MPQRIALAFWFAQTFPVFQLMESGGLEYLLVPAAISQRPSCVSSCAPARMLRRSVGSQMLLTFSSGAERHAEGLNSAVEVHVKQGIFVSARPRRTGWLLCKPINQMPSLPGSGCDMIDRSGRSCPRLDSRLHSYRRTDGRKVEKSRPAVN